MQRSAHNILIVTLLTALGLAAVYGFLYTKIRAEVREATRLSTLIREGELQEETVGALRNFLSHTATERAKLESYLVGRDNVVDFLGFLESLGRRSGATITITSVQNKNTDGNSLADELTVILEGTGSFSSLFHFLSLVESIPMKLEVGEVHLERSEKERGRWKLDMRIKTYTLR